MNYVSDDFFVALKLILGHPPHLPPIKLLPLPRFYRLLQNLIFRTGSIREEQAAVSMPPINNDPKIKNNLTLFYF